MIKLKNVGSVRKNLSGLYDLIVAGNIEHHQAAIAVRACDVIIKTARAQIEHYKAIGSKKKIDFLHTN